MGCPKWQVEVGGRRMLDRVLDAVAMCDSVVLSVGATTKTELLPSGLAVCPDSCEGQGPLAGLLDAARYLSRVGETKEAVVVVSCDVPLLRPCDVGLLVDGIECGSDDAVVARAGGRVHATIACYRLAPLLDFADSAETASKERRLDSLTTSLRCRFLELPETSCRNVNTPSDVAAAERMLAAGG